LRTSIQQAPPSVKVFRPLLGRKMLTRGRGVVFDAWMFEEAKTHKERETLAIRKN
jgi:hypothetical protein